MEYCDANDLKVMNTRFEKPRHKQVTYKETETECFKGPWTPDKHQVIDFVMVKHRWKNSVIDVESRPEIVFNTLSPAPLNKANLVSSPLSFMRVLALRRNTGS